MDYLGQDTTAGQEADRGFLSRLVGNSPTNRPQSDFLNIQCPAGTTLFTRDLYNQFSDTLKLKNESFWKTGTLLGNKDLNDYNTIDWNYIGFTEKDWYDAIHLQYTGPSQPLRTLQEVLSYPRMFLTSEEDLKKYNPAYQHFNYPRVVTLPYEYPSSRDFFYTLSFVREPKDFLTLIKLFDLYRITENHRADSTTYINTYDADASIFTVRKVTERVYIKGLHEGSWRNLPEEAYQIFDMILFGFSLGERYIMNRMAISLTDLNQLQAAYNNISNYSVQLHRMVDEQTDLFLMYPGNIVGKKFSMSLNEYEKSRLHQCIDNLKSYLDPLAYKIAAAGAVQATPEMSYVPTPEQKDPYENINLVYDVAASQQQSEPVFRDISVSKNLQFNATNTPIVDNRIPLAAYNKAPEMMQQWSRTSINQDGFALPPDTSDKTRMSITPYVLGGLAVAVAISQMTKG